MGDDGSTGTATSYDLRYSTSAITAANFASATAVTGEPAPQVAGTSQSMTVSGLCLEHDVLLRAEGGGRGSELVCDLERAERDDAPLPDTTPPSAVTDAGGGLPDDGTSVTLTWTAVGDDGSTGTAASYDLRYSTSAITAANFASATAATGEPAPQAAGSSESFTVSGPASNTTYYFALKVADEVPNWSVCRTRPAGRPASADTTAPVRGDHLAVGTPTTTSLPLTWTAVGDDGSTGTATTYDLRYSTASNLEEHIMAFFVKDIYIFNFSHWLVFSKCKPCTSIFYPIPTIFIVFQV